jgi:hypothetical protein
MLKPTGVMNDNTTNGANYAYTYVSTPGLIKQATPVVSWSNPADITFGTPLSATQLNATANVPGSFAYTPPAGTQLSLGTQPLQALFTPTDAVDYTTAGPSVVINVLPAPQSVTFTSFPTTNQPLGTPDFAVAASATSGLPVTFTASGSCTVTTLASGTTVHLTLTGLCTITASQAGGNYVPASVSQSFTVTDGFVISDFTTLILQGTSQSGQNIPVATPSLLVMTNTTDQTSAAWYANPQTIGNGFSTTFQFSINPYSGADGFAFVIQNSGAGTGTLGTTGQGGYLGYEGIVNSIAIEFDTFKNGWDPNANHVAIQSNGTLANTADHNLSAINVVNLLNPGISLSDTATHTVKITYDGNSAMNVYIDANPVPVLTAPVNLSNLLSLAPGGKAVLGFTAATGASYETTNIRSWSFGAK